MRFLYNINKKMKINLIKTFKYIKITIKNVLYKNNII